MFEKLIDSGYKSQFPSPIPFGTIYNKSSWPNNTDFVGLNGATATLNGSFITMTGASSGALRISTLPNTCLDKQYQKIVVDIGIINSGNAGIGLGRLSTNTRFPSQLYAYFNPFTGQMFMNTVLLGTTTIPNNNDIIQIELDFVVGRSIFTVTNITQSIVTSFTYNYIIGFPTTGNSMPNTGNFVIWLFGTTPITLHSYLISSNSLKNSKLWIAGDSKGTGRFASSLSNAFSELLRSKYISVTNGSGGADASADVVNRIPEMIQYSPQKLLLEIGSNDLRFGVSFPTFQSNYQLIVNSMEAAGIEVYHLLTFPESDEDLTSYKNYIQSTFPASSIIDTWTPLLDTDGHSLNPIYWGDTSGLHFNDAGHQVVFNQIKNFFGDFL